MNADATRVMVSNLTHRRMVDPITFAKRKVPFVIERIGMPDPKNPKLSEER